jgi:two-component system sensor histidine kinase BaeS
MRLRIVHQLSLLLLGAVVLAIVAVGGVVFWNLRAGFSDYLKARDEQELDQLMVLVERRAERDPSMDWLRGSRAAMQDLMDDFHRNTGTHPDGPPPEEEPPPRPPAEAAPIGAQPPAPEDAEAREYGSRRPRPPRDAGDDRPPPPPLREGRPGRPPPPRGERPGVGQAGLANIGSRVQIYDPQGQWLAGRAQAANQGVVQRAIKVQGRTVAYLRLSVGPEPDGVDASFLRRQYLGLGLAALLTFALSLLGAWWVARRWSRPLRELRNATQRIARGDLKVKIPESGAQEIAELIGDVNAMTAALQSLEGARRVWIAQISHELRTPLAVLRGEVESIEDGARQPTPDVIANLRDEVLQLGRLVNDLNTLAMADLGRLPCEFIDGDADAALLRVARRFEPRAAQHGLKLDIQPTHPVAARWDFGRIEQLLTNLLENSLRYTRSPGEVRLRWQADSHELRITIEDTPPGVSPQDMGQLFEPLFRADSSRQRKGQGSGLGLSIARAIVAAHHGSIRAEPSLLGGLMVRVTLPLQPEMRED